MSTFVSVGNATQSFCRLLDEVALIATVLPQPVVVQHGHTTFHSEACRAIPFVEMNEFERLVADAELLILHAGAGSVIHALRSGKVPVVMARRCGYGELVDDHQVEFALALENSGRVVVALEPAQLLDAVQRALKLQGALKLHSDGGRAGHEPVMLKLVNEALSGYARRFS